MSGVAVIIPTYNRAHQIAETIRSVLAQSAPPAEIVVVDDGSTDDTAAIVAPFAPRVRYERQQNAGVSAARNRGAALTTSPLIAFVDSDDLWHPDKLAIQVAAFAAGPAAGWAVTGCDVIGLDGQVLPARRGFTGVFGVFAAEGMSPRDFFNRYFEPIEVSVGGVGHAAWVGDAWLPLFLGNFGLPSSSMVRRDVFDRAGGFDPTFRLAEETEFFHRLAAASPVVILAEPLVGYRVGQAGSLISPANTGTLIANAIVSLERSSARRPTTPEAVAHFRRGRQRLLRKQAYLNLSLRNGPAARQAVAEAWRAGARDVASLGIYAASFLPPAALELLHRAKAVVHR